MLKATRTLIAGEANGEILELDEPLSFWGGFESETGTIIDQAHPQVGQSLVGKIVIMTVGRGSSSASSVLAEAIRDGTAPAALILQESDEIIVLGAIVADEIYQTVMPILLVGKIVIMTVGRGSSSASSVLAEAIRDGTAPAALILQESDEIIVLGAIVADEIYQTVMPILLVDDVTYRDVASLTAAQITADGQIDPR